MNYPLRLGRLLLALLFCCAVASGHAANAASLEGFWKGPLKVPGGQLEVVFRLVSLTNGSYFATLDVPLQKISRLPVTVTTHGDTVVFEAEDVGSRFTGQLMASGKEVQGTWKQPGYSVPMTLQYAPPPISTAPKARLTPPYREEDVQYINSAANLRFGGQLTVPAGEGPFPAVVLVADDAGYDRDGTVGDYRLLGILGDYLTRRGIAVLRFDSRGAGQTGGTLATVDETIMDVQAALTYLRTRPEVNMSQLGVIGHGLGGNVALLTATQPLPPNFVVALAAHGQRGDALAVEQQANTLKSLGADEAQVEAAVKRQQSMMEIIQNTADVAQSRAIVANMIRQTNPSVDSVTARAGAVELTTRRYRSYLAFNPLSGLSGVKCPVLLLNGTADLNVTPETNLTALNKALKANNAVTTRKLPGVNHLFQGDPATWPIVNGVQRESFSPEAEEIIRQWIVGQLKKP
ncbi:alpha/beta fold hydrolase [Hymenobacter sp. HSC-4F20]|uniref:alpha/beta hydrolase family protein n=1 Tax=Hymenobacter sp. HSC-4F20 TaxID=2864135 RepID=UPI001C730D66|nr:alpha/beta hydrolase [Hymenobacter sp. HSC-4F20]MBX0292765.1 alpha/beta fold hydrolase [Hymenobacter sp. HSC-4F20]